MPIYHRLGEVPRKRHTIFRQPGGALYREHLMGALGFSGPSSLLYHLRRPTRVLRSRHFAQRPLEAEPDASVRMRHFHLHELPAARSATLDRVPVAFNHDVALWMVQARETDDFFYRNAQADEIVYVSQGEGELHSEFGSLPFRSGDYVVIPRGILHRFVWQAGNDATSGAQRNPSTPTLRALVVESTGHVTPPRRYCNERGQFLEHSPYCERDIRRPERLATHDEAGEFRVLVKRGEHWTEVVLDHHPLDVVGWDGYYYPWALSIHDFEPITGRLHQPPPVHQTFAAEGFVLCSFVPRLFDYHPQAVPAPYHHSNVMSDEVLYYANEEFMSRSGIGLGSLTLHPAGLPHGPHPGRAEASIGAKETHELAVMVDTFRPLRVARAVLEVEDKSYPQSWLGED
jgi:homogentisate 1,2-dioxygenase